MSGRGRQLTRPRLSASVSKDKETGFTICFGGVLTAGDSDGESDTLFGVVAVCYGVDVLVDEELRAEGGVVVRSYFSKSF